jgi:hypothetical protein
MVCNSHRASESEATIQIYKMMGVTIGLRTLYVRPSQKETVVWTYPNHVKPNAIFAIELHYPKRNYRKYSNN